MRSDYRCHCTRCQTATGGNPAPVSTEAIPEMSVNWRGVFPAATTEFRGDQSLDVPATLRHLDRMIDAGVDGMIMLGTVGENCSLDYREKLDVLKATVGHVAGRVPVLTGVAECTTAKACPFASDPRQA